MSDLTRQMLDDFMPKGDIWTPEEQADFDLLLDGMGDNYEIVRAFLSTLSDIRNPNKTVILSDLEAEYGVPTSTLLSEADRRLRLSEMVYGGDSDGTEDDLQTALRNAGFDVYVYQNDPAVDPAIFLDQLFQMVAGGGNAYAGRADAFAGRTGGELLVNGDMFKTTKIFTSGAGSGFYAGTGHGAGEYEDLLVEKIEYNVPDDPNDWPLVFFVGGVATYGLVDLIVNGGFETGDFTGWTQNNSTIDNINPASGVYCSKLVAVGADAYGAESDSHDVVTSRMYTVKVENDVTAISGVSAYFIEVLCYDGDDVFISSPNIAKYTATTTGYELVTKTIGEIGSGADIIFPNGTKKITIQDRWAGGTPTGTAYMDNVEFYRSDKQSITAIDNATVDGVREDEFKRVILQYNPLHAWAALIVTFA